MSVLARQGVERWWASGCGEPTRFRHGRHRSAPVCVRPRTFARACAAGLVFLAWTSHGPAFAGEAEASGHAMAHQAAEEASSDLVEPIITEETLPNEAGERTLRLSAEYRRTRGGATALAPRIQVFCGLAERLGAEVDMPFTYRNGEPKAYGPGDISASLKWLVAGAGARMPVVVLGLEMAFPTGDASKGTGEGAYEMTPFVALAKDFGAFSVQGNVGWSKQVHGGEGAGIWVYNWALAVPFRNGKVHLLAEVNGNSRDGDSPAQVALAPGVKFALAEKAFVALAAPIGLNGDAERWGLVLQFQFTF